MAGSTDVDFIGHYAKEWRIVSEDGRNIYGSCYGHKIFGKNKGESQWEKLIRLLKKDQHSRRAVLDLYDSDFGLNYDLKDVACSCTVQFLIRKDKLDAIVYMRSNDIIWGLPNDIFFFTMIQEILAKILNVKPGVYYHTVGSLHLYERHFQMADKILNSKKYVDFRMPEIESIDQIQLFLYYERLIRTEKVKDLDGINRANLNSYWESLLQLLLLYNNIKTTDVIEMNNLSEIRKNPYSLFMENYLSTSDKR